jgi:hypothetical protein
MWLKYNNDRCRTTRRPAPPRGGWRVGPGLLNLGQLAGVLGAMGWRLSVCPVAASLIAISHRLPSTGLAPPRRSGPVWDLPAPSRHRSPERVVGLRCAHVVAQER